MNDERQVRQRRLIVGWGVSAVLLIAGVLLLLLTTATIPGLVLFALGAAGSTVVTIGLLRARADLRR